MAIGVLGFSIFMSQTGSSAFAQTFVGYRVHSDPPITRAALTTRQRSRTRKKRSYRRIYQRRRSQPYYPRRKNRRKAISSPVPWKIDESLKGPMQLIVSLPRQRIEVFKGGKLIASSKISSGRPGYRTPAGVFSILQKRRRHYSNLYDNAPMPYMQRITWSGMALHAGHVPNYPASHGCIRLPHSFARNLFKVTRRGAQVVVSDSGARPSEIEHATLFQPMSVERFLKNETKVIDNDGVKETRWGSKVRNTQTLTLMRRLLRYTSMTSVVESEQPVVNNTISAENEQLADLEKTFTRLNRIQTRSKSPLRILITRRTGRERMKDVQRILSKLGYDVGPIDGLIGSQTVSAIKLFEKVAGLPQSGTISDDLIDEIFRVAGEGKPSVGHIYVRQATVDLFDAPLHIKHASKPLGTHIFTAMHFGENAAKARWQVLTLKEVPKDQSLSAELKDDDLVALAEAQQRIERSAHEALNRIEIPESLRITLSDLLTPGSSLVVSDNGISHETRPDSDFIVLAH